MTKTDKTYSIHRSLLTYFLVLVLLSIITSILSISYLTLSNKKEIVEETSQTWADVIAAQSAPLIIKDDIVQLNELLKYFGAVESINYIHIYKIQMAPPAVDYFTSFNGHDSPIALPPDPKKIELLSSIHHSQRYFEFIRPIKQDNQLLGYVYLQVNNQVLKSIAYKIFILAALIIILSITITIILSSYLLRSITKPIKEITYTIQDIAKRKAYGQRCKIQPYKEVDILAKNINVLLARTEVKLDKLYQAEHDNLATNQALKDKVNLRSDALKESNQELLTTLEKLHQFQGQLVESEKMASLGDMVAGVAHEVNTPIGLGVTASTLLLDRITELKDAFEHQTLKSSQLKRFLNEGQENVEIIFRNLNRAANLISNFKKVAVDEKSDVDITFNVKQLINEILVTLAPQIDKHTFKIDIDCPDDLVISSKPDPINQILINLIRNSIFHAFENIDMGVITIVIGFSEEKLNITYSDNGNGVDENIKSKIFNPFITTKRGHGGSGLGLHLVYNLVTQALGGSINLVSEPNKGVTFQINFPAQLQ